MNFVDRRPRSKQVKVGEPQRKKGSNVTEPRPKIYVSTKAMQVMPCR